LLGTSSNRPSLTRSTGARNLLGASSSRPSLSRGTGARNLTKSMRRRR